MSATDPLLGDREARELAVTEFERPIALDAGAGTGKTRALVSRLATWLLGPGWDQAASELQSGQTPGGGPCAGAQELTHSTAMAAVGGAVAITFTEAATAEMARRLAGVIGALANGEPAKDLSPLPRALAALDTGALRDRARALAPLLARLEIQTIHGFCFRLISTHPFDAGLHPAATVDADGARLAEVATRVLLARLREHDPRLVALLAAGVEPVGLLEALSGLVERGVRPAELAAVRFDAATADRILSSLAGELEPLRDPFRRLAAGARRSTTLPPALALIDEVAAELAKEGGEDSLVLLNRIAARVRDEEEAWKKPFAAWRREGLNQGQSNVPGIDAEVFLRQAERVRAQLESVAALQPVLFEAARRAFAPLLEEVRTRLQREGVLSYDELLVRAVGLLEGRPALRRRLRREIRQLLVDEFQDTDRRQCRLLELLALGDDDGPRPGLFVVGDPKQSIYSWRSADLAAYEAFLAGMEAAGGVRRSLAVNFRSRPRLLAEVERLIRPAMQPSAGLQPPYEALLAFREDADAISAGRDRVEHWVSWPEESRGAEARVTSAAATACEARAIAEDIADLARAGHRFSSFALLLRTRGDLEIYLEALRGAGVPYAVEKDRSYYRRREVIDLACAVRAILDPADLLALVAFLRSPLVGVPDAAWIPLWRGGFATALADLGGDDAEAGPELAAVERIVLRAADEIPADVPGLAALSGWPQALLAAVGDLARLRREFARLPAAAWLERLRARLLPEPLAAARFLGRFGLANVRRLLARLERELAATADPHRVLAGLRRGIEEEIEAEDARPPEVDADAVKVMTIHSAKGLEFDQVYLAQLHKLPRRETGLPEFDVAAEEAGGAPSRELVLFGAPSPGWAAADERRRRSRRAESVRLLYVAATRARERLVLAGAWPKKPKPLDLESAETFLDLMADRRLDDLEGCLSREPTADESGALWRLVASPAGLAPAEPAAPPPPRTLPAIVSAATRTAARERSRRSRLLRASSLESAPETAPSLPAASARSRAVAQAIGSAVHRALETAPAATSSVERWQERAMAVLQDALEAPDAAAKAALERELVRLRSSTMWARLLELEGAIVARELPVLLSSRTLLELAGPGSRATPEPLDGVSGALDLLYRDPASGEWVVADFKTDALADDDGALAAKVERYRPQLELYGRAVQEALALDRPPRLELWFVAGDRIIEIVS
jgi:ATP-dependent helicase/nuclease subunit A